MDIDEAAEKKLRLFARLLAEANGRARIVGPSDEETIYREHITDALAALPRLDNIPGGGIFADVGTGGGLPGVVWGICRPATRGVLIDSVGKKIDVVRDIIRRLDLKNIEAARARSEELAASRREAFDLASARAVSDARSLAEYLSPLVRIGGVVVAFKGSRAREELAACPSEWGKLGLGKPIIEPYSVAGKNLNLVVWEKIAPCPARFPRKPGEARKNPWR
jgi:16S rRNA (guanine527-N7)-methyltransferase